MLSTILVSPESPDLNVKVPGRRRIRIRYGWGGDNDETRRACRQSNRGLEHRQRGMHARVPLWIRSTALGIVGGDEGNGIAMIMQEKPPGRTLQIQSIQSALLYMLDPCRKTAGP